MHDFVYPFNLASTLKWILRNGINYISIGAGTFPHQRQPTKNPDLDKTTNTLDLAIETKKGTWRLKSCNLYWFFFATLSYTQNWTARVAWNSVMVSYSDVIFGMRGLLFFGGLHELKIDTQTAWFTKDENKLMNFRFLQPKFHGCVFSKMVPQILPCWVPHLFGDTKKHHPNLDHSKGHWGFFFGSSTRCLLLSWSCIRSIR